MATEQLNISEDRLTVARQQTDQSTVYTFNTKDKYNTKDIQINVLVNQINMKNSSQFCLNDGINLWTFNTDENGNVLIY